MALVLCRPSDVPAGSTERWVNLFLPGGSDPSNISAYWRDMSYGMYNPAGSAVFGWYDIGHTTAEIDQYQGQAQRSQLGAWGRQVAARAGVDLSSFRQVAIGYNINADHGSLGGNAALFTYADSRPFEPTFVQHEFGHALGLLDSASTLGGKYGNSFDIMSAMHVRAFIDDAGRHAGPGASAISLENLRWLHKSRVSTITPFPGARQYVILAALNRPGVNGQLAAKIVGAGAVVYVEYREPTGWDRGLPGPVVLVHRRSTAADTWNSAEIYGGGWTPAGALSPGGSLRVPDTLPAVTVRFVAANRGASVAHVEMSA